MGFEALKTLTIEFYIVEIGALLRKDGGVFDILGNFIYFLLSNDVSNIP